MFYIKSPAKAGLFLYSFFANKLLKINTSLLLLFKQLFKADLVNYTVTF